MRKTVALAVLVTLGMTPAVADEALRGDVEADYEANLEALFLYFHANPELSHREFETARRLAGEIRSLGYEVTEGVGGTGIVAVMKNGPGPTVMLRADMDGLPVEADSGLPYASTARQVDINGVEQPVMHACGHDVHITAMIGTARQMASRRDQWSGTLVLIGQPAEERISGARAMLEDGLYERFPKPDSALAVHVSAGEPCGPGDGGARHHGIELELRRHRRARNRRSWSLASQGRRSRPGRLADRRDPAVGGQPQHRTPAARRHYSGRDPRREEAQHHRRPGRDAADGTGGRFGDS